MKTLFLLLLFAVSASAQTVKWESQFPTYEREFTSCAYTAHPDGMGGCVVLLVYDMPDPQHGRYRLVWIDRFGVAVGQDMFINPDVHGVTLYRIGRRTASFLVRPRSPDSLGPDVVRSYRLKAPRRPAPEGEPTLNFVARELSDSEAVAAAVLPTDPFGHFILKNDPNGQPVTVQRIKNLK